MLSHHFLRIKIPIDLNLSNQTNLLTTNLSVCGSFKSNTKFTKFSKWVMNHFNVLLHIVELEDSLAPKLQSFSEIKNGVLHPLS